MRFSKRASAAKLGKTLGLPSLRGKGRPGSPRRCTNPLGRYSKSALAFEDRAASPNGDVRTAPNDSFEVGSRRGLLLLPAAAVELEDFAATTDGQAGTVAIIKLNIAQAGIPEILGSPFVTVPLEDLAVAARDPDIIGSIAVSSVKVNASIGNPDGIPSLAIVGLEDLLVGVNDIASLTGKEVDGFQRRTAARCNQIPSLALAVVEAIENLARVAGDVDIGLARLASYGDIIEVVAAIVGIGAIGERLRRDVVLSDSARSTDEPETLTIIGDRSPIEVIAVTAGATVNDFLPALVGPLEDDATAGDGIRAFISVRNVVDVFASGSFHASPLACSCRTGEAQGSDSSGASRLQQFAVGSRHR